MKRPAIVVSVLIVAAIALGGGGSPNPHTEIALELIAAAIALLWIAQRYALPDSRLLLGIAATVVILPLVQLIPLPPGLWQALPGRADEAAALALVGAERSWQPWSLSPPRTLAALLSLGPPLLAMLLVAALGRVERARIVVVVAVMGLVSAVLGAAQLAGGRGALRLYQQNHDVWLNGFHANRNAVADVLLISLVALAAVYRERGSADQVAGPKLAATIAAAVLVLAVILTGSRAGIALIPVALVACVAIFGLRKIALPPLRTSGIVAAIAVAGSLVAALAFRGSAVVQSVVARFTLSSELRPELWSDTLFAARQVWPFGSGLGTFVPMAVAVERLETVDATLPNRAHNDYLELLLEGGIFGIAALGVIVLLLAVLVRRAWRDRPDDRTQIIFAFAALIIIAAHSLVDYPLRSMALSCLAGLAAGLLAPLPPKPEAAGSAGPARQ